MSLKTFVKVGSITNLSDARYCAGMGVNQLGFNIDPSDTDYVSPEDFKEITEWVSGVEIVCEGQNLSNIKIYNCEQIEVSNHSYSKNNIKVSLKLNIDSSFDEALIKDPFEYILLHSERENVSQNDLALIKKIASFNKVVLGFGITVDTLESIIQNEDIFGIALNGSSEIRPGYKDYDELADILELLEEY